MALSKLAIAIAIIALTVRHYYHLLGFSTVLEYNDDNCSIIGHDILHGSEDITSYSDGLFFVSSGDLQHAFASTNTRPGFIGMIDLRNQEVPVVSRLDIEGLPTEWKFQPHGIFFSNTTRRLYAISHGLQDFGGTRIYLFSLVEKGKGALPSLKFETTLVSSKGHFFSGSINDIVEGAADGSEIYVTIWLQRPLPAAGKHNAATFQEKLDVIGQKILTVFYPGTSFLRCTLPEAIVTSTTSEIECNTAASGFYGANGITISKNRDTIFVADPPAKKVHVYKRDPNTGALREHPILEMPYMVDNLELDQSSGKIYAGTIPVAWRALRKMDGHEIIVPGSLQVIQKRGEKYVVSDIIIHDGTKLPQISAGYQYKNTAILGSPFGEGVLYCKNIVE